MKKRISLLGAVANHSGAMEQRPLKNGRSSKSQMSRSNILNYVLVATIVLLTTVACGGGSGNIVMKAETDKMGFTLSGSGNITIDWGDGNKETHEIGNYSKFNHDYSGISIHTVSIKGKNITKLDYNYSYLTSLDVSKCSSLTELDCSYTYLKSLDLSKCTELTKLDCSNSTLTSLDLSKCTKLTELLCSRIRLTSLDLSNCSTLSYVICNKCELTSDALNALFETLHSNHGDKYILITGNPGDADCNKSIATSKGWSVDDKWH
jgi:hypothetical protein